jgi:gluconolactonase
MFGSYEVIETEVFARLPDRYRKPGVDSEFAMGQMPGTKMDSFLEGPSFDRAGNLYCVDIPWGRIFRIDPAGHFDLVCEYDGWPNGLRIHKDGRIFIADHKHGIMLVDASTGGIETIVTKYNLEGFKGCNDLTFASNGDLYFTDQGQTGHQDASGRVYRLRPSGKLDLLVGTIPGPNGIVLSLDERRVFVAAARENSVWRLPLIGDGVSKVSTFIQLSGGLSGPDGLALDERGGLVVAHAGLGAVWLFDEIGEPRHRVRSANGLFTTNIAFGGPDRCDLYITESHTGTILRARVPVPGRVLFSHM